MSLRGISIIGTPIVQGGNGSMQTASTSVLISGSFRTAGGQTGVNATIGIPAVATIVVSAGIVTSVL